MTQLKNDRFLRALMRLPVDVTPVWMMRQAGRYLPEYRASRSRAGDFMTLCQTPELACEVTLQPLERFDLDAAIVFSDILTIPDAMGLGLHFEAGEGPRFRNTVRTAGDVEKLPMPKMADELSYVMNAVSLVRSELNGRVPLIGFSGSPWTIATYMIEGGSSRDFRAAKHMLFETPDVMHLLLDKLAAVITDYLNAQILAGAQAVQIFDTWGGVLSSPMYQSFSLHYMTKIISGLIREHDNRSVPVILFTRNGGQWLQAMAGSGAECLGLDWTFDLGVAREQVGDKVALQGNMDPSMLYASPARIRDEVEYLLGRFGQNPGHVFNLGHGIAPDVDPEHARVFIDAVHELSAREAAREPSVA